MKNTAKTFLLIAPLLGLFTVSCGDNFSRPQDAGPVCYYAGMRYTPGDQWKAKDGIHVCVCGFEGQVLCTGADAGTPDALLIADASGDQSARSDLFSDGDTATAPVEARDAAPLDVPVVSDGRVDADAVDSPAADSPAVDASTGDGRLASERD